MMSNGMMATWRYDAVAQRLAQLTTEGAGARPFRICHICKVENPDHSHEPLDLEHSLLRGRRHQHPDALNGTWSQLLVQVEVAFNGAPDALLPAVASMFTLRDRMLVLLANSLPHHPGRNAGPIFEWDPSVRAALEMPL
jgi:hypothetical protein